MGGQGSLMHVGNKGWLVWSDPTHELLLLKLLRKLMLVLMKGVRIQSALQFVVYGAA